MKAWRPALGVRARLTLWYVAAMVIVLTVYAAGVFGFVSRSVSDALEALPVSGGRPLGGP